jgi:hypothetical protein
MNVQPQQKQQLEYAAGYYGDESVMYMPHHQNYPPQPPVMAPAYVYGNLPSIPVTGNQQQQKQPLSQQGHQEYYY